MATTRALAAASVAVAVMLALTFHGMPGGGFAVVLGWSAVLVLALGLVGGEKIALGVAAVIFVVTASIATVLSTALGPPAWVRAFLLATSLELGVLSFQWREGPRLVSRDLADALSNIGLISVVAMFLEAAARGSDVSGTLVKAGGAAALVVSIGWIVTLWRNRTNGVSQE